MKTRAAQDRELGIERARKNEARRQPTGKMLPCDGPAHSNPWIDHCGVCLHHKWGEIPELAPLDLDAARKARADIPCGELSDEQHDAVDADIAAGRARFVTVRRTLKGGGSVSYTVARYES